MNPIGQTTTLIVCGNTNDVFYKNPKDPWVFDRYLFDELIDLGYQRIYFANREKMIESSTKLSYELSLGNLSKYWNFDKRAYVIPEESKVDQTYLEKKARQASTNFLFTFNGWFKKLHQLIDDLPLKSAIIIHDSADIFSNERLAELARQWITKVRLKSAELLTVIFVFDTIKPTQIKNTFQKSKTLQDNLGFMLNDVHKNIATIGLPSIGETANMLQSITKITDKHAASWAVQCTYWMDYHHASLYDLEDMLIINRAVNKRWSDAYFEDLAQFSIKNEIEKELSTIIGMSTVKDVILNLIHRIEKSVKTRIEYLPQDYQSRFSITDSTLLNGNFNMHYAIVGNPGTGKTTAAHLIAKTLGKLGYLDENKFLKVTRNDLVSPYFDASTEKASQLITTSLGGTLFIDEAYSLFNPDNAGDYGKQVIDVLVEMMSAHEGEFSVIIGGYKNEISTMLTRANPGLQRRFKQIIEIPDYTPGELRLIFNLKLSERQAIIDEDVSTMIDDIINYLYESRADNFGNAGEMVKLVEELIDSWHSQSNSKLKEDSSKKWMLIDYTVIPERWKKILERRSHKKDHREIMSELNNLIGLDSVKEKVRRLIASRIMDRRKKIPGHYSFIGNPGTGKTTVARLMGKMFVELGILAKGHLVETSANDFIAGYVGQTRAKTLEKLKEALDGVLFIDEAYSLSTTSTGSFNHEAIDEIIKYMEDHRDRLCVILAGYPKEMKRLFDSNSGFQSRISDEILFPNYTHDELMAILSHALQKENLTLAEDARKQFSKYVEEILSLADEKFDNARFIRRSVDRLLENANLRLFNLYGSLEQVPSNELNLIKLEDVEFD